MAGNAGPRGPVPKRSSERRRQNKESQPEIVKPIAAKVDQPAPSGEWHPIAHDWYTSLAESGQAQFFEPSDWHYARYVADVMSRNLNQSAKFSAVLFASVTSAMNDLLTTEAARRRVRMEINRAAAPEKSASVVAIADYQLRLSGKK